MTSASLHDSSSPALIAAGGSDGPRGERETSATDDRPHVLSASCPLHCLKEMLTPLTFNALDRAISKRFGGHPTIGHVLGMHRNRARLVQSPPL